MTSRLIVMPIGIGLGVVSGHIELANVPAFLLLTLVCYAFGRLDEHDRQTCKRINTVKRPPTWPEAPPPRPVGFEYRRPPRPTR